MGFSRHAIFSGGNLSCILQVIQIKEEGHPCDPNMFADHGTASVGVTSGVDNGFGILGIAPNTSPFTYSEWTDNGGRRERAIAQAVVRAARALPLASLPRMLVDP